MMTKVPNILIVESLPSEINILVGSLGTEYNLFIAKRGYDALKLLDLHEMDLLLIDVMLPDICGFDILRLTAKGFKKRFIPTIFLSDINDLDLKTQCFEMGAVDYISKPYHVLEVQARVKTHIKLQNANKLLNTRKNLLEEIVRNRTIEIDQTRDATVKAVSSLVETRDSSTSEHINRTQSFVTALAETLLKQGQYSEILKADYMRELNRAAPLHDIGKIGIPDSVLLKPGKLTEEEFEIIKKHPKIGYDALMSASADLGKNLFFEIACDISLYHHEKWNGTGYPGSLVGNDIPLSARIMALSDVYDALTSERIYKKAFSHLTAIELILEGRGEHFDPLIVDAFIQSEKLFEKIAFQLSH